VIQAYKVTPITPPIYTHLHTRSAYSFLRGLASPKELVETAASLGMPALALTDYHSLTGSIEFYDSCCAAGIQPILGLEIFLAPPAHLVSQAGIVCLLATNIQGWSNLCRLCSLSNGDAPIPFELFSHHTDGIICLTGGRSGLLTQTVQVGHEVARELLHSLVQLFPDRLYVELQIHSTQDQEICTSSTTLAARLHLLTVATHDVHYLSPEQVKLQKTISAIRLNQPIDQLPEAVLAPPGSYFTSPQEMENKFADYAHSLERSVEIAKRCRLELNLGAPHFPEITCPPGLTVSDILRSKAETGALKYYADRDGALPADVRERLEKEIGIIDECGYAPLFVIVQEILDYAREQGIPFSSRGSAASSLVAHCLGITSPDPIRLNLYFERFLNPARATPPDIDTDICSRRRELLIRHVYRQYGDDRVATVCTINTFRSRSALREVAKAYGLKPKEIAQLTENLPQRWYGPPSLQNAGQSPYAELEPRFPAPIYQSIFRDAQSLIGLPHHLSVHPGGIVISPGSMNDLVPTQMASKGVTITQLDLGSIERIGLVKIDLLGIRGLTVLGDVAEQAFIMPEERDVKLTGAIESIPETDSDVSEMICQGKTIGCFQIESPGMRATLREIHARTVDDLMIALALYRPGPLTGGLKTSFVRRHLHKESPQYLHAALKPLVEDTYGVILYQEQVLRIAHDLGGMSMVDADLLRRAMSHFDPGKQMQTLKEKFIAGAAQRHAVPEAASEKIWELMAAFAGYGFPKAHAASYAQVSWRSAWCKTHYPALFMAAVLANWGGYYSQRVYITEARRLGLTIRSPHINHAQREFSVSYLDAQPILFMGLDQVRDLTHSTQIAIIRNRPYSSLTDFLVRVDPRPEEAKSLVEVGALDGLGTIPNLLHQIDNNTWGKRQFPLFMAKDNDEDDWSLSEKTSAQIRHLGAGVIAHPLELVAGQIASAGAITTLDAASRLGQKVRVAGLRQTWRRVSSESGSFIYFMALEDLEGFLDVIIYPDIYRQSSAALKGPGPYIIEGQVELDKEKGEPFIRAEKIWQI
jgi:DNA-directed DNA polymerase III PolC